jgi:hypothetical protein
MIIGIRIEPTPVPNLIEQIQLVRGFWDEDLWGSIGKEL